MSPLSPKGLRRRQMLAGAAGVGAISVAEWLGLFRESGVPGTAKDWGIAQARAQETEEDTFLVYWFLEGGWDAYSMFSPVHTANHSGVDFPANALHPTPEWSQQFYRAAGYGTGERGPPVTTNGIYHGHLAFDGQPLFPDMAVVSSVNGNLFHSGGRWDWHYGSYDHELTDYREADERTVMQAFAEAKGASFLLPYVSWHKWTGDGEITLSQYPEGTGYYEKLGPAYAHTVYGRTPADLKARLAAMGDLATRSRRQTIRQYTDNLHTRLLQGRDGQSVRAFASALEIHKAVAERSGDFNLTTLFEDQALRDHFGVVAGDELTSSDGPNMGVNARSKEIPHIRLQAMMAYELMRAKVSCALWLENREWRKFDQHRRRSVVLGNNTSGDQLAMMREELWQPLTAFVSKLKATEMPGAPGTSMFDRTTIVICSEMGRTIQGDVTSILNGTASDAQKYADIMEAGVCEHWHVNSVAFMGGNVKGGTQYGRVGANTLDHIPMMPDGSLDPAYNASTGVLTGTKSPQSFIADAGNIYATALDLAGVNPAGKGRNSKPAMPFVKKP